MTKPLTLATTTNGNSGFIKLKSDFQEQIEEKLKHLDLVFKTHESNISSLLEMISEQRTRISELERALLRRELRTLIPSLTKEVQEFKLKENGGEEAS